MKLKLKAKFNMEFDTGTFVKDKVYKGVTNTENGTCWVESEEHIKQGFFLNSIENFFIIIREEE